jgi:hypothetical protein
MEFYDLDYESDYDFVRKKVSHLCKTSEFV